MDHSNIKVLFCGLNHFQSAFQFTKDKCNHLNSIYGYRISVSQCDNDHVIENIIDTTLVIPFMTRITRGKLYIYIML